MKIKIILSDSNLLFINFIIKEVINLELKIKERDHGHNIQPRSNTLNIVHYIKEFTATNDLHIMLQPATLYTRKIHSHH